MSQVFRWEIESMMNRREPVDPELVTRFRKELYATQYPQDNYLLTRAELAALLAALKDDAHVIESLERAALANADRVTQLLDRCGHLMVANDKLRAAAEALQPENH